MNHINKKFLVSLLTSSDEKLLKLSYNTIINQKNHNLDYTVIIVVNSLNPKYYNSVVQEFNNIDVEIIQTISNGKPGMGHNSLFSVFKNKLQYDYLIPIDGDDFLYPYAFHQLTKIINSHNPDICVLQGNDLLSWYNDSTTSSDIFLNNCFYLIKQDEYPHNKWTYNQSTIQINPFNKGAKFITPVRNILCSRKILQQNITNFYCPNSFVIDDYLFFLHFINLHYNSSLNCTIINSNHIYLYNDISIHSAHHNNSTKNDYKCIYDYKHLFTNLTDEDKLTNSWKLLNLPFNYIDPPYPIDFDKYKIHNNAIQITDYKKYLLSNNTQYCINFANDLVFQVYHIFKTNIDIWLSTNNIDKAHKLCQKLIKNNIHDKEIFMFICICGIFLKDDNIVKKYINQSKPFCYQQASLKPFL